MLFVAVLALSLNAQEGQPDKTHVRYRVMNLGMLGDSSSAGNGLAHRYYTWHEGTTGTQTLEWTQNRRGNNMPRPSTTEPGFKEKRELWAGPMLSAFVIVFMLVDFCVVPHFVAPTPKPGWELVVPALKGHNDHRELNHFRSSSSFLHPAPRRQDIELATGGRQAATAAIFPLRVISA